MHCIDCRFYSMWDGVCVYPTSAYLWTSRNGGKARACEDFEDDSIEEDETDDVQTSSRNTRKP